MGLEVSGQCAYFSSGALAASGVISAIRSYLFSIQGYNNNAGAQWIMLFNSTAVPADGTAPVMFPLRVQGQSNFILDLDMIGRFFATGIAWSNSTTVSTKTLGAVDVWLDALFLPRS